MIKEESKIKQWMPSTEWITIIGTIIALFLFVHNENVHLNERNDHLNERLDNHITQINERVDELHKEFYELLKEIRK